MLDRKCYRPGECAAMLGVSVHTLNRMRRSGLFPLVPVKVNRQAIGFDKSEIDRWWESRKAERDNPKGDAA